MPPRPSSSASASLADREAALPLLVARSHSSALPPPAPAVLLEQPFASLDFGDEGAAGGGAGECEASGFCRTAVPGSFT